MPLPFIPEPLEQLKFRYPKCLEKVWKVTEYMQDRPGLYRENIFDFESGLRLLISKSNFPHGIQVHVSASWEWNLPTSLKLANQLVVNAYKSLGGNGILTYLGMSDKGIPHWMIENES